ncbi:hypothetical protein HY409_02895 [Candidatus Gottesmanbacteria bacterium]|nr:hypothetical protein [Candidatus Gottesmanbacteria bacterium]
MPQSHKVNSRDCFYSPQSSASCGARAKTIGPTFFTSRSTPQSRHITISQVITEEAIVNALMHSGHWPYPTVTAGILDVTASSSNRARWPLSSNDVI